MAKFTEKLVIFWQNLPKNAASHRFARPRGGGSRKSPNSGGYFGSFRSEGGDILAIPPC